MAAVSVDRVIAVLMFAQYMRTMTPKRVKTFRFVHAPPAISMSIRAQYSLLDNLFVTQRHVFRIRFLLSYRAAAGDRLL